MASRGQARPVTEVSVPLRPAPTAALAERIHERVVGPATVGRLDAAVPQDTGSRSFRDAFYQRIDTLVEPVAMRDVGISRELFIAERGPVPDVNPQRGTGGYLDNCVDAALALFEHYAGLPPREARPGPVRDAAALDRVLDWLSEYHATDVPDYAAVERAMANAPVLAQSFLRITPAGSRNAHLYLVVNSDSGPAYVNAYDGTVGRLPAHHGDLRFVPMHEAIQVAGADRGNVGASAPVAVGTNPVETDLDTWEKVREAYLDRPNVSAEDAVVAATLNALRHLIDGRSGPADGALQAVAPALADPRMKAKYLGQVLEFRDRVDDDALQTQLTRVATMVIHCR
jgi:hypothetical protein